MSRMRGFTRSSRGRLAIVAAITLGVTGGTFATVAAVGVAGPGASPAVVSGPLAYVTRSDHSVGKINTATNNKVGNPIDLETDPEAIAITPDGTNAYVTEPGFGQVERISHRGRESRPDHLPGDHPAERRDLARRRDPRT